MAAAELAPAPAVEDEPIATMLIGPRAARRLAVRSSGRSSRIRSGGAGHVGWAAGLVGRPTVCAIAATGASAAMAAEASLGKTLCLLVTGCAVGSLFVYAIDGRVQVLTLPKTSSSLSNAFAFLSGMKMRRACTIANLLRAIWA